MIKDKNKNLYKYALQLSYFTVVYNIIEGIASVSAAYFSGSVALIGFGFDSLIESLSGFVMIWRFTKPPGDAERFERITEKLVGISFFILAFYVIYEAAEKLLTVNKPDPSLFGIIIALLSVIIMPILYIQKKKTGISLGSRALIADSKETLACFMLSVALLAGLGLNIIFGFWWADPAAGLFIAIYLLKEGFEAVRGDSEENEASG